MELSRKQIKVLKNANRRWNILTGATRSGKTYISYFLIPLRIKEHFNNQCLFVGKTINTIERNVFEPLREIYGYENIGKIKDKKEIYIFNKKCHVVGANDERAITKIQGMGLGYAYLDEVTTYPENFFQMLKSRLDKENAKCDMTCNPEEPGHFIKKHIDNKELDTYQEHFTIYDNPFLPDEFIKNLEEEYKGTIYFDKWILGKWVRSEGLVYPIFKRDKHYLKYDDYIKKYNGRQIKYLIIGVDGATTNDATVLVPLAILDNYQAVTLDIFYHDPKTNGQLTNQELMGYIKKYLDFLNNKYLLQQNYRLKKFMYIDCSAADLILELNYNFGNEYHVEKFTKKDIKLTTEILNNALAKKALIILNTGPYYNFILNREEYREPLVEELEAMIWDKSNNTYDPKIPNDAADALRYAVSAFYYNPENIWETKDIFFKES